MNKENKGLIRSITMAEINDVYRKIRDGEDIDMDVDRKTIVCGILLITTCLVFLYDEKDELYKRLYDYLEYYPIDDELRDYISRYLKEGSEENCSLIGSV